MLSLSERCARLLAAGKAGWAGRKKRRQRLSGVPWAGGRSRQIPAHRCQTASLPDRRQVRRLTQRRPTLGLAASNGLGGRSLARHAEHRSDLVGHITYASDRRENWCEREQMRLAIPRRSRSRWRRDVRMQKSRCRCVLLDRSARRSCGCSASAAAEGKVSEMNSARGGRRQNARRLEPVKQRDDRGRMRLGELPGRRRDGPRHEVSQRSTRDLIPRVTAAMPPQPHPGASCSTAIATVRRHYPG